MLKLLQFNNCEATVVFIKMINDVFDILNIRTLVAPAFKKALSNPNIADVRNFIDKTQNYIKQLRFLDGKFIISSRKKTGFIGVIISLNSDLNLFEERVVKKGLLIYLPLHKISHV